jgi:Uma2 family endonuclease
MSLPQALPSFTSDQYLSLERVSEIRHEYLDGSVYAMAGESPEHSTLCFNLAGILHAQLRSTPCRGFSPNMKVRTDEGGLYAYPDLTVVCGEPLFHDERRDVLVNPTVIFEVLSPSTEAYDRGEKFLRYRTHLATLTDYLLVTQSKAFIEHFSRQADGAWLYTATSGLTESLALASIDCRLPLEEVYRLVIV